MFGHALAINQTLQHTEATMRPFIVSVSFALQCFFFKSASEYSSKSDLEYEFGDYRGKFCIDDQGFVYGIGEVYYPSPTACPCTCTENGPVCIRPKCPRIHPRCTRIKYKSCCPVCEAVSKVCVYAGKSYRLLEEFKVSLVIENTVQFKMHLLLWLIVGIFQYNNSLGL